jgi:PhzF family phenazine biosynthesis protein
MTTMKLTAYKINAFTNTCTGGNPAGLVINPPQLTDDQMKRITIRLQVSETAFLQPSNHADYHVRFFAPEMEVDLCGHATIATFYTLATKGYLTIETGIIRLTQETNVGILPIEITMDHGKPTQVMMIQTTPIIKDLSYSYKEIASILNIKSTDIDTSLPKQMVSTGLFTLPICIRSFNTLKKIKPDYTKIKSFCQLHAIGSWHVFTYETKEPTSIYHARNFAPLYGINEDPVTGTANGAVTYLLHHHNIITTNKNICEQGDIINHPGRVRVELYNDQVKVGGTAYLLEEKEIIIS